MKMTFGEYLITVYSKQRPRTSKIECLVPGCNKSWYLRGGSQGFTKAAAQRHCSSHWRRYHEQQRHPKAVWEDSNGMKHEGYQFCEKCKAACEEEYKKR